MEPFTAIALLVAQYGIKQVVATLTGNQQATDLAGEIFRQLSVSEDRLGSHLTRIENQLDQVLEQPYETAIGAGARGLLDAVATRDLQARREDLMQARERFRDATAAARSQLQHAVAERYLLLCALALNRTDAAKTALDQLNYHATTAALELGDTMVHADRTARAGLEGRGEVRALGKERRIAERVEEIRRGTGEAVRLVANLLSEAAALGQSLGQTQPPVISVVPWERKPSARPKPLWSVVPSDPGPVRVGTFVITWERFKFSEPVSLAEVTGHIRGVEVGIKIEADPPLSRSVPLDVGWGSVRATAISTPAGSFRVWPPVPQALPKAAREYLFNAEVTTTVSSDGKITETPSVRVGVFDVAYRPATQ